MARVISSTQGEPSALRGRESPPLPPSLNRPARCSHVPSLIKVPCKQLSSGSDTFRSHDASYIIFSHLRSREYHRFIGALRLYSADSADPRTKIGSTKYLVCVLEAILYILNNRLSFFLRLN